MYEERQNNKVFYKSVQNSLHDKYKTYMIATDWELCKTLTFNVKVDVIIINNILFCCQPVQPDEQNIVEYEDPAQEKID